jgi:hypothetical protein
MTRDSQAAARMESRMLTGRGAPLSSPAAVYCTHSTPRQHRDRVRARLRKVPAGHAGASYSANGPEHQRRCAPPGAPRPAYVPERQAGQRQRHQDPHHPRQKEAGEEPKGPLTRAR